MSKKEGKYIESVYVREKSGRKNKYKTLKSRKYLLTQKEK